jgi:poly-gamma-glutamate synthesis protein (capsule biosynthesis protein)
LAAARSLLVDPDPVVPGAEGSDAGADRRELSRRQLLRAGLAIPALALPLSAACSAGQADATRGGHAIGAFPGGGSNPATTGAPSVPSDTGLEPNPGAPRGPRGSGQTVTFAFAGDVHFVDLQDTEAGAISTGVPVLADRLKADPTAVLAPIAGVLSAADLAMVNLETAVTERGEPVAGKAYHFRSAAESFIALKSAGVDVVNMANNHALDYGAVGMQDTFDAIAASGLPVVGIGRDASEAFRPYRTVIKGQRIAIFGAVDWLEPALVPLWSATETKPGLAFSIDRTRLLAAVEAVRPDVDTLIAFLHWGTEETHCASAEQQRLAQSLLGAGADIIVGSHAHRVFGAGRVGTSLVAYGLGNFVYWREDGESGRSGVLLVEVAGRQVDAYSWVPARITHGIPVPETGGAANSSVAEWANRRVCSGLLA